MSHPDERWRAVGEAVTARAKAKAYSQADLVRASGVSDATVRPVMRGEAKNYRPDRLAKISQALGWPPDGIERLLAGESATTLITTNYDRMIEDLSREVAELRALVERLLPPDSGEGDPQRGGEAS